MTGGPTAAEVLAVLTNPNRPLRPGEQDIRDQLEAATATRCPRCDQPVTITRGGRYQRHQPDQGPWAAKRCPLSRKEAR